MKIEATPTELVALIKELQEQPKPHLYEDGSGFRSYEKHGEAISRTSV